MRQEKIDSDKKDENTYANEYMSIYGSNEPDTKTVHNSNTTTTSHNNGNIAHEAFDAIDTLNNPNVNIHDSNITPDILLEQLAYVDNFIPSLDQDFVSLDSWVMNESQNNSTNNNHDNNNISGHMNTATGNTFGLDEQLAVELSAFADEVFIFPDEDKPQNNNSNNSNNNSNNGSDDENKLDYDSTIKKDEHKNRNHILSQRRNKFLSSQYDHSRSRFSSRRSHQEENNDDSNSSNTQNNESTHATSSTVNNTSSFNEDHSGFTNFEVDPSNQAEFEDEQQDTHNNNSNNNNNGQLQTNQINNSRFSDNNNTTYQRNHVPSISSPLSNLVANNPARTKSQQNNNNNNNHNNQVSNNEPQIHLPDYSQIPTSTLVALLPRVKVPQGAHESLLRAGFADDQITAIAAIIAYNEQRKNQPNTSNSSTNNQSNQNSERERSSSDKGAHFLLDLLTDKSKMKPTSNLSNVTNIERPISQPISVPTPTSNSSNDEPDRRQKSNISEPVLDTHISTGISNIRQSTSLNSITNNLSSKGTSGIDDMRHLSEPIQRNHNANIVTLKEKIVSPKKITKPIIQKVASLPIPTTTTVEVKKESQSSISYSQKKKLKGKELENSINELNDLALKLQQKIHTLEMENKLLKDLVVNSGEQEGLEQAESIKQNLLKRAHESTNQGDDESKKEPGSAIDSGDEDNEPSKKKRNSN